MATTARDLDNYVREAETRDRTVSKSNDNETKVRFSKGGPKKKKSLLQELSNRHKDEDPGLKDSKGSALKRTDVHKRKENPSRISKQRSALYKKLKNNRTFSFDKTRDAEFRRDFNESDGDEPDWDPRLRSVKAKFEHVTIKKKKEAKKIWTEIEEARSDSDSANEKESSDDEKSDIDGQEDKKQQNGDADNESGDGSDKEHSGADVKWDSEVKNTLEALRETRSEGNKSASTSIAIKGYDCDEDPWFWDSNGNAPVKVTPVPVGLKRRMGAQLKNSIEKVQLKDFRKEFYEKLNSDAHRISESSSQDSSSSSIPSSLSSDIEDSMGNPKARKELKTYLENSSDDEEVIVYTSRGPTIRRPPTTKPPIIRKRGRRHNWSDHTSESSTSTSSSDTENSSGSQNVAALDKH